MNWMEIALLIIGAGVFVASFLIPDKNGDEEETQTIDEGIIKTLIEREFEEAKERVVEVVDETLEYAVEKTERASERICNEKIMSISDYSETVLADINKSHQEVMFLYDMLNDKHNNLKETVKQVDKTAKEAEAAVNAAAMAMSAKMQQGADSLGEDVTDAVQVNPVHEKAAKEKAAKEKEYARRQMARLILPVQQEDGVHNTNSLLSKSEENQLKPLVVKNIELIENKPVMESDFKSVEVYSFAQQAPRIDKDGNQISVNSQATDMLSDAQNVNGIEEEKENNNDRILSLYKKGVSNMDIAKELGLGVGEVNLVINLFKGTV